MPDTVADLKEKLRRAEEKIKELRAEHQETLKLNDQMRDQVQACSEQIERWIDEEGCTIPAHLIAPDDGRGWEEWEAP